MPPRGHLVISGDIFGCHSGGKGSITDTQWAEARDAVNILPCTGRPHSKLLPSPECQQCPAEKPHLSSREAEPKLQEKRMGQEGAFAGKGSEAAPTGCAARPVHQQTEAGDKRGKNRGGKRGVFEPNYLLFCLLI